MERHLEELIIKEDCCCEKSFDYFIKLYGNLCNTVWTPNKTREINKIREGLDVIKDHYYECNPNSMLSVLHNVESHCDSIRQELGIKVGKRHSKDSDELPWYSASAGVWCKRLLLTLGLSFLTFSTVRYWYAILYPTIRQKGIYHMLTSSKKQDANHSRSLDSNCADGIGNHALNLDSIPPEYLPSNMPPATKALYSGYSNISHGSGADDTQKNGLKQASSKGAR